MSWIFDVKTVDLRDSYAVGGDTSMNIIIAPVPVLNMPEEVLPMALNITLYYIRSERANTSLT